MVAPAVGRLVGVVVSVTMLIAAPAPSAWASGPSSDDAITPESANTARFGVEQDGKALLDSGAFEQAADLYWREGVRLKDPVLILDSAEALRSQADAERSIDAARAAIDRVAPALDMLYFLRDGASSAQWQPIATEYLATVTTRAEALITDANTLIAEIEDEQRRAAEAAAAPVEPETKQRGPAKPGTGLIAAGSGLVVLGLGGAGLGVAGLALGAQAQADVVDPLVYEPEHQAAEQQGQTANVLAGVGFALAGVGIGAGIALLVVGVKQRRQAGDPPTAEAALVPMWLGGPRDGIGGGIGLVGRF